MGRVGSGNWSDPTRKYRVGSDRVIGSDKILQKLKKWFFDIISITSDYKLMKLPPLDSPCRDESNGNNFISNGQILTELFNFTFRVKFTLNSGRVG